MATECPIRMTESTDIWAVPKKPTRYKSSSSKLSYEDLGLFLQDQRFLSPEKDSTPCRSESAPPNMEGSVAAIRNMFSFQGSALNRQSMFSTNLGSLNSLPVHAEESDDDGSSVRSCSVSGEKTSFLGCPNTSLNSKKHLQEDSCCSSSPSYDQNNPQRCKSREGTLALDVVTNVLHNISLRPSSVGTNTPCSDDMSQISSLDGTRDTTAGPYISNSGSHLLHKKPEVSPRKHMLQHGLAPRESVPSEVQGSYPQIIYPGMTSAYGSFNQMLNVSSCVPNAQPMLHASGYTPPFYANAAAFIGSSTAFYPNLQHGGYIAPNYIAGYNYNPNPLPVPSYMLAYPNHGVAPFALGGASFSSPGVTNGAYDMQNLQKFYGQVGAHMHPRFTVHYIQPNSRDSHGFRGHFGDQLSRDGAAGPLHLPDTSYSSNRSKGRINSLSHYTPGSSKDADFSGRNPHSSDGDMNKANEQSQVSHGMNSYSFLEELKSGKGQRFELPDIAGHIVEFSVDQHGSRFIQQKLEICSVEEKASVLKEVIPHASKLMTDVFGNYVIQKLFEYGSPDQQKYLTNQLEGQILTLSLQMYGCRVIQKALEVIDLEQKTKLVRELDGHVMRCVLDQNGNHVIQKCIESIPTENIHFIVSSFRGQVVKLSMHPYGCRVIQRVLEHCSDNEHTQFIVDEILDSVCSLAQDQYGNYVTQHVLERGKPHERKQIVEKLAGSVVQLSQHKFASNVVERCIECSDSAARELLIRNIVGHGDPNGNLLIMMKDQYANYVVQKIIEKCCGEQRETLLGLIRSHVAALKKYTYGKHIVARFDRLCGEGEPMHRGLRS